jgi:hypothetical protein
MWVGLMFDPCRIVESLLLNGCRVPVGCVTRVHRSGRIRMPIKRRILATVCLMHYLLGLYIFFGQNDHIS